MANDKDFIVKNAVEVGGSTKTTLGTVTNDDIDLSTGNYFAHTPVGATTYTISNAGDVQTFQVEVTGGAEEVAQNFSTTIYSGDSANRDIVNNIDLATDGGMVWIKSRTSTTTGFIFDTERGATKSLTPSETGIQETDTNTLKTFNTNGFSTGTSVKVNGSNDYVSWTFKNADNFFDVQTWSTTYNTTPYTLSVNLVGTLGAAIFKSTDATGQANNWVVWHRALSDKQYLRLNTSDSVQTDATYGPSFNSSTNEFTFRYPMSTAADRLISGGQETTNWVGYFFAHDTADDGLIQCGGFTTNSSGDASVTLGWQPQWILYKRTDGISNWGMHDTQRVWSETYWNPLYADVNNAESGFAATRGWPTSTGFEFQGQLSASANYIYVAIRSAADLDLTWPTSIEWAGGVSPAAPATGETDLFSISTDDGGTTYQGFKVADNLS